MKHLLLILLMVLPSMSYDPLEGFDAHYEVQAKTLYVDYYRDDDYLEQKDTTWGEDVTIYIGVNNQGKIVDPRSNDGIWNIKTSRSLTVDGFTYHPTRNIEMPDTIYRVGSPSDDFNYSRLSIKTREIKNYGVRKGFAISFTDSLKCQGYKVDSRTGDTVAVEPEYFLSKIHHYGYFDGDGNPFDCRIDYRDCRCGNNVEYIGKRPITLEVIENRELMIVFMPETFKELGQVSTVQRPLKVSRVRTKSITKHYDLRGRLINNRPQKFPHLIILKRNY